MHQSRYVSEPGPFRGIAYGLAIDSVLPLPELVPTQSPADVRVRLATIESPWSAEPETSWLSAAREGYLSWKDVGTLRVYGGTDILVDPIDDADPRQLRLFLLGPALAVLLHQRHRLVLHASAVSMNDCVVAFLGSPGSGKSTLAGALHARNHLVVADDLVAVDVDETRIPMVHPGFPQLKLWPDAAAVLCDSAEMLSRLHHLHEKRAYPVVDKFATAPLPLRCVYVLSQGPQSIEAVKPQDALVELIRHTYTARLLDSSRVPAHFFQCADLAVRVPVRRLTFLRSLPDLPALAALVEKDLDAVPH